MATGNTIRELLCAHNLETVNLVNDSHGVETGLRRWLKSLGIKATLKMQTKELKSQSQLTSQNMEMIEDALKDNWETILGPVEKSGHRARAAANMEPDQVDSEHAKAPEEATKRQGLNEAEFLVWLRQFGQAKNPNKGRENDAVPHPRPLVPGRND